MDFSSEVDAAQWVQTLIKSYVNTAPENRMPDRPDLPLFDEPLLGFADADDPLFAQFKTIIGPAHLTPREALATALRQDPADLPKRLSVISWILPIPSATRASNRRAKRQPSRRWAYTRWYGEQFNEWLRAQVACALGDAGYPSVAPALQPYFAMDVSSANPHAPCSNWSERHVAYVAGLGTFSLNDGLITEKGIAHRCGSVVTTLTLPASPRSASGHLANCLHFVTGKCMLCASRCPVGAISEKGHDKRRCFTYSYGELLVLKTRYGVGVPGCGRCQTGVPCERRNPARGIKA